MEDKRAKALKGLRGNSNEDYKKLSDGTIIGRNILDDLKKYMELELKYKYKVDATIWNITQSGPKNIENLPNSKDLKDLLNEKLTAVQGEEQEQPVKKLIIDGSMKKYNVNFYTCIELDRDHFARPVLKKNNDSRLKARIVIDKNELDKIFKKTNISSLDGLVLLEFYSEFNKKYKDLKSYLVSNDSDIKKDIVEDLYNKLFNLYDIKVKDGELLISVKDYIKKDYIDKYNSNIITGGAHSDSDTALLKKLIEKISSSDTDMPTPTPSTPSTPEAPAAQDTQDTQDTPTASSEAQPLATSSEAAKKIREKFIERLKENKDAIFDKIKQLYKNSPDDEEISEIISSTSDVEFRDILNGKKEPQYILKLIEDMKNQKNQIPKMGGGAGNDQRKQEKELPTLSDHFNSLRDLAVKIITIYYKLIGKSGEKEENDILKGFFKTDDDEDALPDGGQDDKMKLAAAAAAAAATALPTATPSKSAGDNVIIDKILQNEKDAKALDGKDKSLKTILKEIIPLFVNLYKICNEIKNIPQATEYEDFLKKILNKSNIRFFEKKDDDEKHKQHPIIKAIIKEIEKTTISISDNRLENKSLESQKKAKEQEDKNNADAVLLAHNRNAPPPTGTQPVAPPPPAPAPAPQPAQQQSVPATISHGEYKDFKELKEQIIDFVKELKENTENVTSDDGNKGKSTKDKNIFDKIWDNYNLGMNKNDYKGADKFKNQFNSLREGRKLYDSVIQNNLDPELILEINLQDKAIFIFLIFLIRTIIIISIEFLIEYNMIKTLQFAIILYGFVYLLILCLFIIFVNYDSYKLRIIFNYLNLHINSSNILLHIILFTVFTALVYIIIQSDNFLKNFGYMFDYTNIYNHIYEMNGLFTEDSDTNISRNEKLKLLYRTDIISMIVFIFTSCLILIM
jgi:hypothetical protein